MGLQVKQAFSWVWSLRAFLLGATPPALLDLQLVDHPADSGPHQPP